MSAMIAPVRNPVASVTQQGDELIVAPRLGLLPEMKTLGAKWDKKRGAWKLPAAQMHVAAIHDLLHDVEWTDWQDEIVQVRQDKPGIAVSDRRLFTWQLPAVERLVNAPRGCILVASPGLGKTAMSVVAADHLVPGDQVVVVAPAPLLRTWARQIQMWGKGDTSTVIIHGGVPDWEEVTKARWLITSWEVLALHQDWFMGGKLVKWPLWIMDESVKAKSRRSTLSMAMRGGTRKGRKRPDGTRTPDKRWENLRSGVERVWLLSGSPTTRHADDLWAQLAMIWPKAFPSYWRFAERYCIVEPNQWAPGPGTVVATRRDRDAVADNSDMIMVINQKDVINLPEYLPEAVDVDLTLRQREAYEEMTHQFMAELDSGEILLADNRMAQLMRLQQIASFFEGSSSKHDALIELMEGGAYETPLLVWTHWRDGAESLAARLRKTGLQTAHAYGGMTDKAKDDAIEGYKNGRYSALVLSLGVGKFGHTLTNTRTVAYIDKTWNADDYLQSLLRVKRIGLTWRPVLASFRVPGTVDELVELNLEGKVQSMSRINNADLKELLMGLGR